MGLGSPEQLHRNPLAIEGRRFGAKAPPTGRSMLGRSGFSRDPCVIENHGFGIAGAAFTATLLAIEAESSGLKPLLQKPMLW
jgi:hypothetical protein